MRIRSSSHPMSWTETAIVLSLAWLHLWVVLCTALGAGIAQAILRLPAIKGIFNAVRTWWSPGSPGSSSAASTGNGPPLHARNGRLARGRLRRRVRLRPGDRPPGHRPGDPDAGHRRWRWPTSTFASLIGIVKFCSLSCDSALLSGQPQLLLVGTPSARPQPAPRPVQPVARARGTQGLAAARPHDRRAQRRRPAKRAPHGAVTEAAELFSADEVEVAIWHRRPAPARPRHREGDHLRRPAGRRAARHRARDPEPARLGTMTTPTSASCGCASASKVTLSERGDLQAATFASAPVHGDPQRARRTPSWSGCRRSTRTTPPTTRSPAWPTAASCMDRGNAVLAGQRDRRRHRAAADRPQPLQRGQRHPRPRRRRPGAHRRSPSGSRAAAAPGDLVARLGGDEFAVLLTALPAPAVAAHRAEGLLARAARADRRRRHADQRRGQRRHRRRAEHRRHAPSCCAAPTSRCTRPNAPASGSPPTRTPATPPTSAGSRSAATCPARWPSTSSPSTSSRSSTSAPARSSPPRRWPAGTTPTRARSTRCGSWRRSNAAACCRRSPRPSSTSR